MTAGITMTNGVAEMAYAAGGEMPWWGGGNVTDPAATIEDWAKAAGMAWSIKRSSVTFRGAKGHFVTMKDRDVLYRDDNEFPLGVVSKDYHEVQPRQQLEGMFRQVEKGGFKPETAGTLFGGKQFWVLASIGADAFILDPRDKLKRYLLGTTSCDGTTSTIWKFLDTRVVCFNTLSAGLSESGREVRFSHKMKYDQKFIDEGLGLVAREQFEVEIGKLRKLTEVQMTEADVVRATLELYEPGAAKLNEEELTHVLRGKQVRRISELAFSDDLIGNGFDGVAGTAWGFLNAVTQYIDHDNGSRTIDRRFKRAMFGKGDKTKTRAHALAINYSEGVTLPALVLEPEKVLEIVRR